ncbi:MAG: hypothetical protein HC908_16505 [Calothrix sp. SM1_7_51]|nr:hypothetical protein [Calothrix sp. SM1_7_51]
MSEQSIQGKSLSAFLLVLLPFSFAIIFFVSTWRIWVGLGVILFGLNIWRQYQWEQWSQQVNPVFYQAILESQGKITPIDFAVKGNFPGDKAKKFLEAKASEFGATIYDSQDTGKVYYFITAGILGNILDSSEPPKELMSERIGKTAYSLLEAPPKPVFEEKFEEKIDTVLASHLESHLELVEETSEEIQPKEVRVSHEHHVPLEQQLLFGSLIQSELAKRLNVYSSTVFKRRNDPDFSEWSRAKDPDGIAWVYSRKTKEFFPAEEA